MTQEEVIKQVMEKCERIAPHLYVERAWLWYAGPSLQGEANKPIREAMKAIGFRFCAKGRDIGPDLRGSWAHSCTRPLPRRFGGKGARRQAGPAIEDQPQPDPQAAALAMLASL